MTATASLYEPTDLALKEYGFGGSATYGGQSASDKAARSEFMKTAADVLISYGSELKAEGTDANGDFHFGGYLVLFDSHDVSRQRDKYLKSTDYDFEDGDKTTIYFHHGLDETLKATKLGTGKLYMKDAGVWMDGIIKARTDYLAKHVDKIKDGIKGGVFGLSSGVPAHLVERKAVPAGHEVLTWPLGKDASITHIPAEPKTMCFSLKSLMEEESGEALPEDGPFSGADDLELKYSDDEERDDHGRWTSGSDEADQVHGATSEARSATQAAIGSTSAIKASAGRAATQSMSALGATTSGEAEEAHNKAARYHLSTAAMHTEHAKALNASGSADSAKEAQEHTAAATLHTTAATMHRAMARKAGQNAFSNINLAEDVVGRALRGNYGLSTKTDAVKSAHRLMRGAQIIVPESHPARPHIDDAKESLEKAVHSNGERRDAHLREAKQHIAKAYEKGVAAPFNRYVDPASGVAKKDDGSDDLELKYSDDQERDDRGRWTAGGASDAKDASDSAHEASTGAQGPLSSKAWHSSDKAKTFAAMAGKATSDNSREAYHGNAAAYHEEASKTHSDAAVRAGAQGDHESQTAHSDAAAKHTTAAAMHRGMAKAAAVSQSYEVNPHSLVNNTAEQLSSVHAGRETIHSFAQRLKQSHDRLSQAVDHVSTDHPAYAHLVMAKESTNKALHSRGDTRKQHVAEAMNHVRNAQMSGIGRAAKSEDDDNEGAFKSESIITPDVIQVLADGRHVGLRFQDHPKVVLAAMKGFVHRLFDWHVDRTASRKSGQVYSGDNWDMHDTICNGMAQMVQQYRNHLDDNCPPGRKPCKVPVVQLGTAAPLSWSESGGALGTDQFKADAADASADALERMEAELLERQAAFARLRADGLLIQERMVAAAVD